MESKPKIEIVLCDIDGTIANIEHRLHFIKNLDGTKKRGKDADWESFNKACVDDAPYQDVIDVLKSLAHGRRVIFVSGRDAVVRDDTMAWLIEYVGRGELYMRKDKDFRPDTEVKLEMVQGLGITPDNVLCILDDRQHVVDMWRDNGFRCLQVAAWQES